MADIHILPENGEAVAIQEECIPGLLSTGHLSPTVLYWREGMADWEPLSTFRLSIRASARRTEPVPLAVTAGKTSPPEDAVRRQAAPFIPELHSASPNRFAVADSSASGSRSMTRSRFRFRRNPWPLTLILELVLVACLVITLLELAQEWQRYQGLGLSHPTTNALSHFGTDSATAEVTGKRAPVPKTGPAHFDHTLQRAGWIANLLLLVPYFMWLYRTTINCRHLSSITRIRPALTIGNYFIPFVNLFRPFQDMQEIWRVSGNPRSWLNDRGSILVGLWWILALITLGISIETLALFSATLTHDDDVFACRFFLGLKSVQAAWYVSFLLLVGLIMRRQARVIAQGRQASNTSKVARS